MFLMMPLFSLHAVALIDIGVGTNYNYEGGFNPVLTDSSNAANLTHQVVTPRSASNENANVSPSEDIGISQEEEKGIFSTVKDFLLTTWKHKLSIL